MNKIQTFLQNMNPRTRFFTTIGGIVLLIWLVCLIPIIIFNNRNLLTIDNLSIQGMPNDTKKRIYSLLYNTVKNNLEDGSKTPTRGAKVRNDTVTLTSDDPIFYGNFVVDIPSVEQSYLVYYKWSTIKNDPNVSPEFVTITCLHDASQIIYPEFRCVDNYTYNANTASDPYAYLYSSLPYYGTISTGEEFRVAIQSYAEAGNYLSVSIDSCGNKKKLAEAEELTNAWIETFNINPENVTIHLRDLCEGGEF